MTSSGDSLQSQINERRREIQTESYSMSVGEVVNLYRDRELDIHPEFQRFFRWSTKQKSRFIESLLLGIPIPSIFIYQRSDGVWDVIDGLQRLSTIFEFMGLLEGQNNESLPQLTLEATDYLPGLAGRVWSANNETDGELMPEQQRLIKRSAIDVKIVKRESDEATKYDLFQRLNTGGSQLSEQELRNCLLIMVNGDYYRWTLSLRNNDDFLATVAVSDRAVSEQYDLELVLRFLYLSSVKNEDLNQIGDMSDFLDERSLAAAKTYPEDENSLSERFALVFSMVNDALGDSAFRRFNHERGRFMGGFSVSAYEAITVGLSENMDQWGSYSQIEAHQRLQAAVQALWKEPGFRDNSGSGIRSSTRLRSTIPFAREYFRQ